MAKYINVDNLLDHSHSSDGSELVSLKAIRQAIDSEPIVDTSETMAEVKMDKYLVQKIYEWGGSIDTCIVEAEDVYDACDKAEPGGNESKIATLVIAMIEDE